MPARRLLVSLVKDKFQGLFHCVCSVFVINATPTKKPSPVRSPRRSRTNTGAVTVDTHW